MKLRLFVILAALLLNLIAAPWQTVTDLARFTGGSVPEPSYSIRWTPLWDPPTSTLAAPRLRLDVLFVQWVSAALLYYALHLRQQARRGPR